MKQTQMSKQASYKWVWARLTLHIVLGRRLLQQLVGARRHAVAADVRARVDQQQAMASRHRHEAQPRHRDPRDAHDGRSARNAAQAAPRTRLPHCNTIQHTDLLQSERIETFFISAELCLVLFIPDEHIL